MVEREDSQGLRASTEAETDAPDDGEQEPEATDEGSPVPDPESEDGADADDVPGAV